MVDEQKMFKAPEEKKREETFIEEKKIEPHAALHAPDDGVVKEAPKKTEAKKEEKPGKSTKAAAKPAQATAKQAEKPKPSEAKKEEKKREIVLERIYSIPLSEAYKAPRNQRANKAVKILREYLAKHFKTAINKIKIENKASESIKTRGHRHPLKKIRVNASKDKEGIVLAVLAK